MATRPTDYGGLRDLHKDQGPSRPVTGPHEKATRGPDYVAVRSGATQDLINQAKARDAMKGHEQTKFDAHRTASRNQRGSTQAGRALSDHISKTREGKVTPIEHGKGGPADGKKGWER